MTSPTEAEARSIAKGLTADERQALASAPTSWFNLPSAHQTCRMLRARRLVRSYRHEFQNRHSMALNGLGLAVRRALQEQGAEK